jgi:hypothetical protein|tara:strand:- start:1285 stop:2751 length:1467 start_codon:yes stop_codon:yes gene_type:complete
MSKIEVDQITQQSGSTLTVGGGACKTATVDATTVTIGRSGGTVSLASGATQSGFGRSGSVDWQTGSIKTSTFTASSGEGYFIDTSSGTVTANLPAGSAGAIVSFADYTRTFQTNKLTITPNGSEKIGGVAASAFLTVNGQAATFVYVDGTEGWINVQNAEDTEEGTTPAFVAATGGTVTTVCTNFKVHTFTSPGTFTVTNAGNSAGSNKLDYLVVAGGGAGGGANGGGGGGGAGGFRFSNCTSMPAPQSSPLAAPIAITASATAFPITVGGGGSPGTGNAPPVAGFQGGDGSNSIFATITSTGGGGGGGANPNGTSAGRPGGSGGGEGGMSATGGPGSGNTPATFPPQGNPGGDTNPAIETNQGSGGGGAACAGSGNGPSPATKAGPGGAGSFVVQTGFAGCNGTPGPVSGARYFSGGGGGQAESQASPSCQGTGGAGGGGAAATSGSSATSGGTNTGGGGGGIDSSPSGQTSGAGGSGIVIIRYKFQ